MLHSLLDWSFLGVPGDVWFSSLLALVIGISILWVSKAPKLRSRFKLTTEFREEITRDIGIAFLVAAVVSLTYEWSTRVTAEHQKIESVLHTVMGSVITPEVWNELNREVLPKQARRANVEVNIKLQRNAVLSNGAQVPAPENQAILWMEYKYDLYNLKTVNSPINVQHGLDSHMQNTRLTMPRFERVTVNGEVKDLSKILDGWNIKLEGAHKVELPPSTVNKPVQIATERYEIVGLPGSYTLVLPDITTGTIKVSIVEPLPEGVQVVVHTGWSEHEFKKDANQNVWTLNGIMLPGQCIIMEFRNEVR